MREAARERSPNNGLCPPATPIVGNTGDVFRIGSFGLGGGGEFFGGLVDSIHVFNKSLTAMEIRDLYLAESGEIKELAKSNYFLKK